MSRHRIFRRAFPNAFVREGRGFWHTETILAVQIPLYRQAISAGETDTTGDIAFRAARVLRPVLRLGNILKSELEDPTSSKLLVSKAFLRDLVRLDG